MLLALHSASLRTVHYLEPIRPGDHRTPWRGDQRLAHAALPRMVTISHPTVLGGCRACDHRLTCGVEMCRHMISPP
ncbi:hypothetical protein Y032_0019g3750 [Ancylostoma ceylanicum]|uniref:Uncharacterized protein n=1 Tax=Ancylostoma ceylanicum TaxID=53326 RepID=A0A016V0W0_9BILA|nr:hypothetical protein Y032_0019g3750 [Ancylostoma ceylanicum]